MRRAMRTPPRCFDRPGALRPPRCLAATSLGSVSNRESFE